MSASGPSGPLVYPSQGLVWVTWVKPTEIPILDAIYKVNRQTVIHVTYDYKDMEILHHART